ncbi:MAG TPA: pyrroloquinoline quinone-dependent dehydrogenase [Bryobacteraceae bacterium]|nr:pyrroloquinoline quinone-dependent dehydrogenase [Bryobacteraceae bacterium]
MKIRRYLLGLFVCSLLVQAASNRTQPQEWPWYGGDAGGNRYSQLTDINRANVKDLKLAWEWKVGEKPIPERSITPGNFEATPLMIDGVLYISTPYNRVAALDAGTGRQLWIYDPKAYEEQGQALNGVGYVHRGVAAWRDNGKLRLFLVSHYKLICLDAESGKPVMAFGDNGVVDLSEGFVWAINKKHYTNTSPPAVYRNLVILSNSVDDRVIYKHDPPGDIRAYDAHTGKRVWVFHTVPQKGEPGNETWQNDSWSYTGHANAWAPITLDEKRGLVYFPLGTPSNDFYGGQRPGNNLYGESLVCLDAATGKLKWHFQTVHHGLWDYDLPAPPNLVTLTVDGRKVDAAVQLTKMGFIFVFDRVTGAPVFPIEERPVPASDVPGEQAWPTQPFPVKPPPITPQGVTLDDAFDLTPELKAEATAEMKKYRLGPLFTPPSLQGTLMLPGILGGPNWGGGAFDPETGILYLKSSKQVWIARVAKPADAHNPYFADISSDYTQDFGTHSQFHNGLPLVKPPYGLLNAVDLNHGTIAWQVVFGDTPAVRNHPALKGVTLPDKLGISGVQGPLVTKGGLIFIGGGDRAIHAIDKNTAEDLWTYPLDQRTTSTPSTYRTAEGKQFVVIAAGNGADARLLAFALPN